MQNRVKAGQSELQLKSCIALRLEIGIRAEMLQKPGLHPASCILHAACRMPHAMAVCWKSFVPKSPRGAPDDV